MAAIHLTVVRINDACRMEAWRATAAAVAAVGRQAAWRHAPLTPLIGQPQQLLVAVHPQRTFGVSLVHS